MSHQHSTYDGDAVIIEPDASSTLRDALPIIVWTAKPDGEVDYANQRLLDYTGVSPDASPGSRWQPYVHPDDLEGCLKEWEACVRQQRPFYMEYRLRRSDGVHRWFRVEAIPIRNKEGEIGSWMGYGMDINDFKLFEQDALESRNLLQRTVENMPIGLVTLQADGLAVAANSRALELLGLEQNSLPGVRLSARLPELASILPDSSGFPAAEPTAAVHVVFVATLNKTLEVNVFRVGENHGVFLRDVSHAQARKEQLHLQVAALTAAADNIAITDRNAHILWVNPSFVRSYGYTLEETIGRRPQDLYKSGLHDKTLYRQMWNTILAGRTWKGEITNRRKDGSLITEEMTITPVRRGGGEITHFISIKQDIGPRIHEAEELKRAHEMMAESENRFRLLSNATNDVLWDWNLENDTAWWNEGVKRMFGLGPEEMGTTSDGWKERIHPEDRTRVVTDIHAAIQHGREEWGNEYRFLCKDGTYSYVMDRGHILRDKSGRAVRMFGGMTDLTERKNDEEKLREQAELLDKASDAIMVRDLDHRIVYCNRSAEKLYGWAPGEAKGRLLEDMMIFDPEILQTAGKAVVENGEWRGEVNITTLTGEKLIVDAGWTLVRNAEGKPRSILSIVTDITQRRKIERHYLRAQRMESIGTMAGGIAHDLNNALAPILMSIEILKMNEMDSERLELLAMIEKSALHGSDLVRHILTFTRGSEAERHPVNLLHVARDTRPIINDTFPKNITFHLNLPEELWQVNANATQISQVLMNLCVNARDAMPDGGTLTVTLSNVVLDDIYSRMNPSSRPGPHVLIQVEDTGIGISKAIQDKIFDPFFTTKEVGRGTGLGLATVLGIVQYHDGFINLYSEEGHGTTFKIYIPAVADNESVEQTAANATGLPRGNGETILLVDDDPAVRVVAKKTLERFGYRVMLAAHGAEAVALYAQNSKDIHLVLTDMSMPIMDGPALIVALRSINSDILVVGSSGHLSSQGFAKAIYAKVEEFIAKPFTAESLLTVLRRVLDHHKPAV